MTDQAPHEIFATALSHLDDKQAAIVLATIEKTTLSGVLEEFSVTEGKKVADWNRKHQVASKVKKTTKRMAERVGKTARGSRFGDTLQQPTDWVKERWEGSADHRNAIHDRLTDKIGDRDPLAKQIEDRAKELEQRPVEDLRRMLVKELSRLLDVTVPPDSDAPGHDWYHQILEELAQTYKVDVSGLNDSALAEKVIEEILTDALQQAKKVWDHTSEAKRSEMAEEIAERLRSLDPEAKRRLMEAFGVDDLTKETIRDLASKGILFGGAWFAAIGAGFGLFLAATTILHAVVTTLLGVTLSFSTYTAMTTLIAALINPFTAVALASGLGYWMVRRQQRELRHRVAALALVLVIGAQPIGV